MRIRTGFLSALLLTLLVFAPATAGADTITITGGFLDWGGGAASLSISGSNGFTYLATLSPALGIFAPGPDGHDCEGGCVAGTPVSLQAHWSGVDASGTATYAGTTYEHVGGLSSDTAIEFTFTGTAVTPGGSGILLVKAPFMFAGTFGYPVNRMMVIHPLRGQGNAALTFSQFPSNGQYRISHVRYEFGSSAVATPEPASMMLLGFGLAGAVMAGRRRAK